VKKRPGRTPSPLGRGDTQVQHPRNFAHFEIGEVFELHEPRKVWRRLGESSERAIEIDEVDRARLVRSERVGKRDTHSPTATLLGTMPASVIEEDAAHHVCRDSQKMGAILPRDPILVDQPEVRFVDERCRLERVLGSFAPHQSGCNPTQIVEDDGCQTISCRSIPFAELDEKPGNVFRPLRHRSPSWENAIPRPSEFFKDTDLRSLAQQDLALPNACGRRM
jgi:hypothetical protein